MTTEATRPGWDVGYVSRLVQSIRIMLGLGGVQRVSLTSAIADRGLDLREDAATHPLLERLDDAIPLQAATRPSPVNDEHLEGALQFLRSANLSRSLLRDGIAIDNYRVREERDGCVLMFRPGAASAAAAEPRERAWRIANYPTRQHAVDAAHRLRHLLLTLNRESEGLHIVEHVLLRPPAMQEILTADRGDFYGSRMSVFLPNWTARFGDPEFQHIATRMVRQQCPAHIVPTIHWLDFPQMLKLELHYLAWLVISRQDEASTDRLDAAAWQLANFIQRLAGNSSAANTTNTTNTTTPS